MIAKEIACPTRWSRSGLGGSGAPAASTTPGDCARSLSSRMKISRLLSVLNRLTRLSRFSPSTVSDGTDSIRSTSPLSTAATRAAPLLMGRMVTLSQSGRRPQ